MPRGDGTGPSGMGPMSGRAAGYCAGYSMPGYANSGYSRSRFLGMGRGGGQGRRQGNGNSRIPGRGRFNPGMPAWGGQPYYYPEPDLGFYNNVEQPEEPVVLKQQAEFLKEQLSAIEKRLLELEKNQEKPDKK